MTKRIDINRPIRAVFPSGRVSPARIVCSDRRERARGVRPLPLLILVDDPHGERVLATDEFGVPRDGGPRIENVPDRVTRTIDLVQYPDGSRAAMDALSPARLSAALDGAVSVARQSVTFTVGEFN